MVSPSTTFVTTPVVVCSGVACTHGKFVPVARARSAIGVSMLVGDVAGVILDFGTVLVVVAEACEALAPA